MMMQLLAEASTIDAGAVGQIISTLVGAGAIGGGGYVMGKARKISLSNDPLNVRKANEYATKEDIARLEREIRDIKNDRKEDLGDIYDRLNEQGRDLHEIIGMLKTLTPREEKVLRLRFGIEDGRTRTLEEVGKEFNVTRERIRQIEAKALRKLRHPSRSKKLKDFLN